jgi:hypothetical protein
MTLSEQITCGVKRKGAWHLHQTDVERELALTRELLDAERRRADRLDALLAEERQASAELRRLLAQALSESGS